MSKPSENLVAARNVLIEDGWIRGSYSTTKGHCAIGALRSLRSFDVANSFETQCLADAIGEEWTVDPVCPPAVEFVMGYNDEVAESPNDILDIFDRAIVIAKEAEA